MGARRANHRHPDRSRRCRQPRRACGSGDQIVAINGVPVRSSDGSNPHLQKNDDKPVEITALRNGQELKFNATPVMTEDNGQKRYRLGFQSEPVRSTDCRSQQALNRSLDENKKYSLLIVDLVRKMAAARDFDQADGRADRHRARFRRRRQPAGMDSAASLMARNQPESRHLQPAADSDSRWRHDSDADHRRASCGATSAFASRNASIRPRSCFCSVLGGRDL